MRATPPYRFSTQPVLTTRVVLWRTYGSCENFAQLTGHKAAVLDLRWSRDSETVFSASADATIAQWDVGTGQRLRRHVGHADAVNALDVAWHGPALLYTGSDDGSLGVWDARQKAAADYIESEYPITAVAASEAGHEVYTGGIDDAVKVWDLRKKAVVYSMRGHADTVTGLELSPDAQTLLSCSHDGTVRTWDVKPFAPGERLVRTYDGATPGLERNLRRASWDASGGRIAAGSGDRSVVVWETRTGKLLYKLPGHRGTVNDVRFSPTREPISTWAASPLLIWDILTRFSSTFVLDRPHMFARRARQIGNRSSRGGVSIHACTATTRVPCTRTTLL